LLERVLHGFALRIENRFFGRHNNFRFHRKMECPHRAKPDFERRAGRRREVFPAKKSGANLKIKKAKARKLWPLNSKNSLYAAASSSASRKPCKCRTRVG
jgi:hypothetical protein